MSVEASFFLSFLFVLCVGWEEIDHYDQKTLAQGDIQPGLKLFLLGLPNTRSIKVPPPHTHPSTIHYTIVARIRFYLISLELLTFDL